MTTWRQHGKALSGVVYLVLIALLVLLSVKIFEKDLPWQSAADVTLRTADPGLELNPHSDVKYQGVHVGEVKEITSDGRTATVELALDKGKLDLIPANVDAAIVPKTLFGEKFVDLRQPASPSAARLAAGGQITQSTTSVEIGTLFSNLVPVLEALKPQQLSVILNSLAQALDGRGEALARSFNQLRGFSDKLDPHLDTFTRDIGKFAQTADIYADAAPDLLKILSATAGISRELLVPQEKEFAAVLDQTISTSGDIKNVLATNADNLIRLSGRSRDVLALLDEYSSALPCFLRGLDRFGILSNHTIGASGPFTNLIIDVVSNNTPYTNPKDLPTTPGNDADNDQLPFGVPSFAPHCPQFSKEVLALKDAAPNSQSLHGTAIDVPQGSAQKVAAPSDYVVAQARDALARALAAQSLGVPADKVPGYAGLLIAPMLTDGQVSVP
jgi:phospholipid/cholesterol/gamma-HCH transport system substrate-binding protein